MVVVKYVWAELWHWVSLGLRLVPDNGKIRLRSGRNLASGVAWAQPEHVCVLFGD